MDINTFIHIFVGSTFGLTLRLLVKYSFKRKTVFYFDNSLTVNVLSSLFLGFFIALNSTNNNLLLLVNIGFLGCLSTFSSFIYQLFNLIHKRKYLNSILFYIEVLVLSFLFFCLGYFVTLIFKH